MNLQEMTKEELIDRLNELHSRVADLERLGKERAGELDVLRDSRNMLGSLLQSSPEPMIVYDDEGRVLFLNEAFATTFGWSTQELLGRRIDYVPEDYLEQTRETLEGAFRGEHVPPFDTRRLTEDGRILDVHISSALFRDSRGRPATSSPYATFPRASGPRRSCARAKRSTA
jgi:PAS domain S-box-containing protein